MNSGYSMDQELIEKLTKILEVNFDKENFGVKELAKKAGLSRSKLHRKLHAIKGKSTSKFIREYRLEKALIMLKKDVATASEISYRVGFSSPQYFSKCFQDYYGYTPGEAKYKTHNLIEDSKEVRKKVLIEGFQNITETKKNRRMLFSKQMIWISIFGVVLISIFSYFLYSNYYFSSYTSNTDSTKKSIAIIPFKNLSNNIENQYFADGMMDEILNQLSGIHGLVVKSRQSSEKYRESDKSMIKIGKELDADYLLEGSVQKQKDSIRIIVQLINAKQDIHVWSENYDFELKQVFSIQSKLSKQIAQELNTVLSSVDLEHIEKVPTDNLEAYKMYLNGRFHWNQRTEDHLKKSIYYFTKAIELDSTYAIAYAGLADSYFIMEWYGWTAKKYGFNKAKTYSLKALSIDNNIAEAHATLGAVAEWYDWNWEKAEQELKLAITLNPNYATGHLYYSEFQSLMGKYKEAQEHINKALELNPHSLILNIFNTWLYYEQGKYNEAINCAKKVNELEKGRIPLDWMRFPMYLKQGNDQKIIEIVKRDPDLMNGLEKDSIHLMDLYKEKGIEGIVTWRINFHLKNKHFGHYSAAKHFMLINNRFLALDQLEKAYQSREVLIAKIEHEPALQALRDEPRFKAILKKMGLED